MMEAKRPRGRWDGAAGLFEKEERVCFEMAKRCQEEGARLPCVVSNDIGGAVADWLNVLVKTEEVAWPPEREQLRDAVDEPMGRKASSIRL